MLSTELVTYLLHRNYLEAENDREMQEMRLSFATFISNIINSLPQGKDRFRLFSQDMRYSLFHVFANWCGMFGIILSNPQEGVRYVGCGHSWVGEMQMWSHSWVGRVLATSHWGGVLKRVSGGEFAESCLGPGGSGMCLPSLSPYDHPILLPP